MPEKKDIEYLARIARIEIAPDEVESYLADLRGMLGFVDKIRNAEVSGVPAIEHVLQMTLQPRLEDEVIEPASPARTAESRRRGAAFRRRLFFDAKNHRLNGRGRFNRVVGLRHRARRGER